MDVENRIQVLCRNNVLTAESSFQSQVLDCTFLKQSTILLLGCLIIYNSPVSYVNISLDLILYIFNLSPSLVGWYYAMTHLVKLLYY